jgi:hypothetical protein
MPYIDKTMRIYFHLPLEVTKSIQTPGQLNYLFTQLFLAYLGNKGESYQSFNDIIGALEGAKLELYRRQVAKYEDMKASLNGDVYEVS